MTNEEKATELYKSIPQYPYHIRYDESIENFTAGQLCDLLEEMAKWKEKQYAEIIKEECNTSYESGLAEGERKAEARVKEYLEKKHKKYTTALSIALQKNLTQEAAVYDKIQCLLHEIINKLFKKD